MITIDFRYLELNADKYRMLVNKLNNNHGPKNIHSLRIDNNINYPRYDHFKLGIDNGEGLIDDAYIYTFLDHNGIHVIPDCEPRYCLDFEDLMELLPEIIGQLLKD